MLPYITYMDPMGMGYYIYIFLYNCQYNMSGFWEIFWEIYGYHIATAWWFQPTYPSEK
jgi:hypothetical protein